MKRQFLSSSVKTLAPGTEIREGLDNILRAKTGALIVFGETKEIMKIVDGGFNIDCEYTPARLYELAKMDGALVLTEDYKRILYANAQLMPDPTISSRETGTRHRTAERVAKETGALVISISQRRNIITLYKGNEKYALRESGKILAKANQAIQTLERYKVVLDKAMNDLSALEFDDSATLYDVNKVLQRSEMVLKVVKEIEKYIFELGDEGRLVSMQLEELMSNVREDRINLIKDYCIWDEGVELEDVIDDLELLSSEELLNLTSISKILGYEATMKVLDSIVSPKGYRIMYKLQRVPHSVLKNVIEAFGNLQSILEATEIDLEDVDGIGEVRARIIKDGLKRLYEKSMFDRNL